MKHEEFLRLQFVLYITAERFTVELSTDVAVKGKASQVYFYAFCTKACLFSFLMREK